MSARVAHERVVSESARVSLYNYTVFNQISTEVQKEKRQTIGPTKLYWTIAVE